MMHKDVVRTAMRIAAQHINEATTRVNTSPSDALKTAGNYSKGHFVWNGLKISIETPKGAVRSGRHANGKEWRCTAPAHYGYFKRSIGADDDHIDVYMGPNPLAQEVYVIDQTDARTKRFDEHKVMAGFSTKDEAIETYKKAFSDNRAEDRIGAVTKMGIGQFKRWLLRGDTTAPLGM